ncbi:radical SAM protein [Patescibacteria group bacterium]|nr:radical SAM protein [Patescibacteria group bacterium]
MANHIISLHGRFRDEDGTEKYVFESGDGIIEITHVKNKGGIAVFCLPTHHYCNLGCKFCHLTEEGDRSKPMNPIKAEVLAEALAHILNVGVKDDRALFSFMGVGEPFLNIHLIHNLYEIMKEKFVELSLALATMITSSKPFEICREWVKGGVPLRIHFSMHSPLDKQRLTIIPASAVTVVDAVTALVSFKEEAQSSAEVMANMTSFHEDPTPVEIHYTVIAGVNDSDEELAEVIALGQKFQVPFKIIKFNPTKELARSSKEEYWL